MKPVCFAAVLPLALAPPAWAGDMDVAVAPFVWAPAMRGTLQEGPVVIPLDTSARDLAGGIRAGGMVHAEADADALHASVQAIYADFHDRSFAPVFGADVKSSLFTIEALAGPRIGLGKVEIAPMAGIRHTRIKGTFDAAGLGRLSAGRNWSEGLIGIEAKTPLTNTLSLRLRGTAALLGPRGHSSVDMIAAASLAVRPGVSLVGGYRWAREKVLPAQPGDFGLNLRARGPVAGIVFGL